MRRLDESVPIVVAMPQQKFSKLDQWSSTHFPQINCVRGKLNTHYNLFTKV